MDTTEELWDRAHEHLALGEFELALDVAEDMAQVDLEASHEIRALALSATDRTEEAIEGIEAALAANPDAWRLHLLHGNLFCDLGDPERAHVAYSKAAACEGVEPCAVAFDRALLFEAEGELAQAFALLEPLGEPEDFELATRLDALLARVMTTMEMPERALALVEDRIDNCDGEGVDLYCLSELLCERARAMHVGGYELDEVVEALLVAIDLEPAFQPAAELLRQVENRRTGASKLYHVVAEVREPLMGSEPKTPGLEGYYRSYRVIAETPEAAGEYVLRYEQAEFGEIVSCDEKAPMPGEEMGVVEATSAARFTGS